MSEVKRLVGAEKILQQLGGDVQEHCQQVSRLAGKLFEQTAQLHHLGADEKDLLLVAGLLHDLGITVSVQGHHKISQEIISQLELPGFTASDQAIIACVARYHRKSHPALKHEEFSRLNATQRELVRQLAALLRIADGLDRSHFSTVKKLHAYTVEDRQWVIEVSGDGPMQTEIWAANELKKQLFEEVWGVQLTIVAAD